MIHIAYVGAGFIVMSLAALIVAWWKDRKDIYAWLILVCLGVLMSYLIGKHILNLG
jgi:hypothetical protein